jgi:imidazolonepropionase-like amidohydrolase
MHTLRFLPVLLVLFSLVLTGSGQTAKADEQVQSSAILLRDATIITGTGVESFVGSVLIQDGKISKIWSGPQDLSSDLGSLENLIEYNLSGYVLTPGLIDCRSVLWLESGAAGESSSTAGLDITSGIDPFAEDWKEVLRQGVTTVGVRPNGSLGGYAAALTVGPSQSLSQIILADQIAVTASIGVNATSSTARFQEFNRLKSALKKVAAGEPSDKEKESEEKAEEEEGSEEKPEETPRPAPGATSARTSDAAPPSRVAPPNRTDELLKRVAKGEIPLHVRARHSDVIGWLLALRDELDIRLVLEDVSEANRMADRIKQLNLPLIVGPFGSTSQLVVDLDKTFDPGWIAEHAAAGGLVAISPFSNQARGSRLLRVNAANAVATTNLSRANALQAITLNPAKILGIAQQTGSIEIGKRADLAVFAGDPLDPSSPVSLVFSHGKLVCSNSDQPVAAPDPPATGSRGLDRSTLPQKYAIHSNHILQQGVFRSGFLQVQEGKIVDLAAELDDSQWEIIHLPDAVITPGLVAVSSHLGHQTVLGGNPESDATLFRSVDVFDSERKSVKQMRACGFLHIGMAPLPTNTSAGSLGQVRLNHLPEIVQPNLASQFVLSSAARDAERYPSSLPGQVEMLDQMIQGRFPQSRLYVTQTMRRWLDQEKESLMNQLKAGRTKGLWVVGDELEFSLAVDFAKRHGLGGGVLVNTLDADSLTGLSDSPLGIVISAASGNEVDRHYEDLVAICRQSLPIGFAGEDGLEIRTTAALLAAMGAPKETLLKGLTEGAAELIGMTPGTARLTAGGAADFVIWNGSPLDLSARPLMVVVDGKPLQPSH